MIVFVIKITPKSASSLGVYKHRRGAQLEADWMEREQSHSTTNTHTPGYHSCSFSFTHHLMSLFAYSQRACAAEVSK